MTILTPTELQQRASDPKSSVWVAASAGSGKTKVLVDRVLRLLLQDTSPDNILCITYTTAAAAEMLQRVTNKAREWTLMAEEALRSALYELQGYETNAGQLRKARSIFLMLADASPGLRVLTIHSFCQNMLNQFPVEAGIAPHFTIIDDAQQREFLNNARAQLLTCVYHQKDLALNEAMDRLSDYISEFRFETVLNAIIGHRRSYAPILRDDACFLKAQSAIYDAANMNASTSQETLLRECFDYDDATKVRYKQAAQALYDAATPSNKPRAESAISFFSHDITVEHAKRYLVPPFTTASGSVNKNFISSKFRKSNPSDTEWLERFASHIEEYHNKSDIFYYVKMSDALLIVARYFFGFYRTIKEQHHALDFDDLIILCLTLLDNSSLIDWVLYKLDGQIDHILIDEAQDTSQEQWRLTHALTSDFFAGQGAKPYARSVFVVGDEKQSIYRFQGAAPDAFTRERQYYRQAAQNVMQPFEDVGMHTSFRSVRTVLSFVDAVFASDSMKHAVSSDNKPIEHKAFRTDDGGQVVLHPLFVQEETVARKQWMLPHELQTRPSPLEQCAHTIAKEINEWLIEKRPVAGRIIQPKDILILVRKRGTLVDALSRELHRIGVPVAGNDRLNLHEHIAIKDMLALCRVLVDVHDDMSLAALMTSPFYNATYERLNNICARRAEGQSVWRALHESNDTFCNKVVADIEQWREYMRHEPPYKLLCRILFEAGGMDKFVARMGESVRDVLQNLLYKAESFCSDTLNVLPNFIEHMEALEKSIKRDMEQGGDEVRIMTVHGSKGLEAPVVILPDTMSVPSSKEEITAYPYDDTTLMLFKPPREKLSGVFEKAAQYGKDAELHEYYRLLYVALTRARDEIHCWGYCARNTKKINEKSWYAMLEDAMIAVNARSHDCDITGRMGKYYALLGKETDGHINIQTPHESEVLPHHLTQDIFHVPPLQQRQSPSTLYEGKESYRTASWAPEGIAAKEYGTLLHYFLELQCGTVFEDFVHYIECYIQHVAGHHPISVQQHISATFKNLIEHHEIVALLNRPAFAEIPVIGTDAQHRSLSGAVDRIIIEEKNIVIIDFKHGVLPENKIPPEAYHLQMLAYKELIAPHYVGYDIQCKLVYIAPVPEILDVY